MTPTQVLATTLKRLYPQNPDVVLGREARTIIAAFEDEGYAVVWRGCRHVWDPECARCQTLRRFQPWLDNDESDRATSGANRVPQSDRIGPRPNAEQEVREP